MCLWHSAFSPGSSSCHAAKSQNKTDQTGSLPSAGAGERSPSMLSVVYGQTLTPGLTCEQDVNKVSRCDRLWLQSKTHHKKSSALGFGGSRYVSRACQIRRRETGWNKNQHEDHQHCTLSASEVYSRITISRCSFQLHTCGTQAVSGKPVMGRISLCHSARRL